MHDLADLNQLLGVSTAAILQKDPLLWWVQSIFYLNYDREKTSSRPRPSRTRPIFTKDPLRTINQAIHQASQTKRQSANHHRTITLPLHRRILNPEYPTLQNRPRNRHLRRMQTNLHQWRKTIPSAHSKRPSINLPYELPQNLIYGQCTPMIDYPILII